MQRKYQYWNELHIIYDCFSSNKDQDLIAMGSYASLIIKETVCTVALHYFRGTVQ